MSIKEMALLEKVGTLCKELEKGFDLIPVDRKQSLLKLSDYVSEKYKKGETPKLVVVCTHNSRRSHLGQIWLAVGADYFQLPSIETYSGGTEATAFNIRAVRAVQRAGFKVFPGEEQLENPVYQIRWTEEMVPYNAFSKKYDSLPNPKSKFAAIMVCTEADEACPIVNGAEFRLSLPFDDPKAFDETDLEEEKYSERLMQIGREMLFVMSVVSHN